jgi:hypothetical protein
MLRIFIKHSFENPQGTEHDPSYLPQRGLVFAYNISITVSSDITRISLTQTRYNAIDE